MNVELKPVTSCPTNASSWLSNGIKLQCPNDTLGRNLYQCVPNDDRSSLVEFCLRGSIGRYGANLCPYAVSTGHLDALNCSTFLSGCPEESYNTNEVYKYHACLEINSEEKCYFANENCPNDSMSISQNTTNVFQPEDDTTAIIAGVVSTFIIALIALVVLYLLYLRRRGHRGNRRNSDTWSEEESEEESAFLVYKQNIGSYGVWRTEISDRFSKLTDDGVSVLFCFLCSDSGPPDFTDTEWLSMLNEIRLRVCRIRNPVTRQEAQQTLDRLKSHDYLWEDQDKIRNDTTDETMYRIASIDSLIPFIYSSYYTASVYLRSWRYNREPGEKCVCKSDSNPLLIRRLQMNILTHVTMEDTSIYDKIYQILNIPDNILNEDKDKRKKFLIDLRNRGESVHYRERARGSVDHVTWLWRYGLEARPDIVRSYIGLHPHWDIYIIDNKAYRKPSEHRKNPPDVRCLLYSLLLTDKYQLNLNEQTYWIIRDRIRDRYFPDITDFDWVNSPNGITETRDSVITFISDDIRHDVMYAFVTECLVEDSDLECFLTTASRDVISEYCRSWDYKWSEGERCLYIPNEPEKMYDLFIDKLQLDIISHCTVSDLGIHGRISEKLRVPSEILQWDQEARERYVEYAKRGTQSVHHARGMIVGCAGAGKTTLLKRLLGCSKEEIKEVKSTEGLDVHEEIFELCDETKSIQGIIHSRGNRKNRGEKRSEPSVKTLTFFDFGGQCAYYACHQIYLTRRAFYIVVVDASKDLDQVVHCMKSRV